MKNNKYYTPELSDFKQGFKFEVLHHKKGEKTFGTLFIDSPNEEGNINWSYAEKDVWEEMEVWWDRKPEMRTKEYDDGTVYSWIENKFFDLQPGFNIETYLKDGRIRAKR